VVTENDKILHMLTPQDLAIYLSLSALAQLSRKEMSSEIISSSTYRDLIDACPET
jgi:hypothetical protein